MNTENNKLIAEFMGGRQRKDGIFMFEFENSPVPDHKLFKDLKYHTSWDWLMPVVEKISKIPFGDESGDMHHLRTFGMINIETGEYMVRFNRGHLFSADSLIEATYQSVVEFIRWYNQTPHP